MMSISTNIRSALAAFGLLITLLLISACTPAPLPQNDPPPEAAVDAPSDADAIVEVEPVIVADLEDGVGAYVEPVVVEAAPLGTSWGENISSSVGSVDNSRMTSLPAQTMDLYYSGDAPRGKVSNELQLLDRSVRVRVLREDGTPWPIYQTDGEVHLQGAAGERYIIEVSNDSSTPIEFALSVDGLAEYNGRPAKQWGNGFIIRPNRSWRFEGFRKNDDEVAAFRFSDVSDSVAITRGSGSASDAGVINFRIYRVKIND